MAIIMGRVNIPMLMVYEGDWKDDRKHGKGIERRSDGTIVHDGDWKDDKACVSVTST